MLTKFKETEIGKIPEDWEIISLEQASELLTDGSHFSPKEDPEGDCFIATVKDMGEFEFDLVACKRISRTVFDKLAKANCKPEKGDVLFSKDGTMGLCFVYSQDAPLVLLSSIAIIRPTKEFDSYFLKYHLSNPKILDLIISGHSSGSALPRLTLTNLKGVPILKPPLAEQRAIAKILSNLDAKIKLNRQMNATLEKMAEALFKHWFVDFEFPNEQGKPYKSSGGKMVESELGLIPEGWGVKTIGEVVEVKGGSTPSTTNAEYWENGQIYWCTPKDLSHLSFPVLLETERKISDKGLSVISSGLLPEGTLLLSSRAPIGYLAISEIPVAINQGFIAINCNKGVSNYYMLFWVKQNMAAIKNKAHGTTFEEINKASFRSINIVLPKRDILKAYDKIIQNLYLQLAENERESLNLSKIRDSLLPKLMSGKIRAETEVSS